MIYPWKREMSHNYVCLPDGIRLDGWLCISIVSMWETIWHINPTMLEWHIHSWAYHVQSHGFHLTINLRVGNNWYRPFIPNYTFINLFPIYYQLILNTYFSDGLSIKYLWSSMWETQFQKPSSSHQHHFQTVGLLLGNPTWNSGE